MARRCKDISGNPGGGAKILAEVQELARQHTPAAIAELARLALKGKSEHVRIAASRELIDRGYGRSRPIAEADSAPTINPFQVLLDEIDQNMRNTPRYYPKAPA
jgi:hypothetical protein